MRSIILWEWDAALRSIHKLNGSGPIMSHGENTLEGMREIC